MSDDAVKTQYTPTSNVVTVALAAPWGQGSNVKSWWIYSGFGMTHSYCFAQQSYPQVFHAVWSEGNARFFFFCWIHLFLIAILVKTKACFHSNISCNALLCKEPFLIWLNWTMGWHHLFVIIHFCCFMCKFFLIQKKHFSAFLIRTVA